MAESAHLFPEAAGLSTGGPPLPAVVQIGTVTHRVTADPDAWMRIEHSTQTKGYYGHTHHHDAISYLNPGSSPDVQRVTLWYGVDAVGYHPDNGLNLIIVTK